MNLADLRRNYALKSLLESDALASPFEQFKTWFLEAQDSQVLEPNAMTLATAGADGRATARVVLLKELSAQGFVFFTNYESRKGKNIAENPQGALLFVWLELERQVRIEGRIEKIAESDSLEYFQSRPKGSQIGAWSSPQSSVIAGRTVLSKKAEELAQDFADVEALPLPPFWGGYVLVPDTFEFWQGRESRLHDRIQYRFEKDVWHKERLAP